MPTISALSALIAREIGNPGDGRGLARELARLGGVKPSAPATTGHAVALLLGHLGGLSPRKAIMAILEMLDFRIFGAFRFTVDHGSNRGESEASSPSIYPATAFEALSTLIEAARRGLPALSRPYSIECGTRYGINFVTVQMEQIAPDAEGRSLRVEVIYAAPDQTAVADYQVPSLGRWSMSACGGDIIGKIAKALGPASVGGGELQMQSGANQPEIETREKPLAARPKAKRSATSETQSLGNL
jgi:hypothetical protein